MIDSGASTSFIDESFIKRNRLRARKKLSPETVRVVDGRQSSSGHITHEIDLQLQLGSHSENLTFQVTRIARYHVILGKSWLSKHDPEIKWSNNIVSFTSPFCQETCLVSSPVSTYSINTSTMPSPENVTPLSISALLKFSKRWDSQIFSVSIKEVGEYSEERQNLESEESADLRQEISPQFHGFLSVFSSKKAEILPPHRYIDHEIPTDTTQKLPLGPLYSMSNAELEALRQYLKENLEKGFIEPSTSSCRSLQIIRPPVKSRVDSTNFPFDHLQWSMGASLKSRSQTTTWCRSSQWVAAGMTRPREQESLCSVRI